MIGTRCPWQFGQTIPTSRVEITKSGVSEISDEEIPTADTEMTKPRAGPSTTTADWDASSSCSSIMTFLTHAVTKTILVD
jgi:hypothetical protein